MDSIDFSFFFSADLRSMCGALSLLSLLCVVRIRCYVYIHVTILYLRRTGSSDYFYSLQVLRQRVCPGANYSAQRLRLAY